MKQIVLKAALCLLLAIMGAVLLLYEGWIWVRQRTR
jgi:hypothetical protein